MRLQRAGARAEAVLVQQPRRRLPHLRRPRASRISSIPRASSTHPHLSLAGGAIRGWDRRNAYYFQLIQSLAQHYKFDIETPWDELPAKAQQVVLFGSGDEDIEFRYAEGNGRTTQKKHQFEGIMPNLERRYQAKPSRCTVREELAKYLGMQPCPDCNGTRLNRAARYVFVGGRTACRRSRTSRSATR